MSVWQLNAKFDGESKFNVNKKQRTDELNEKLDLFEFQ